MTRWGLQWVRPESLRWTWSRAAVEKECIRTTWQNFPKGLCKSLWAIILADHFSEFDAQSFRGHGKQELPYLLG